MTELEIDGLLRRLPPIRRARGHRLYAEDGRRFLDFWQDGGRGVLGARHAKLGLGLKATLDRGLDRPLPSRQEARLAKLALALVPGARALRLYRNEDRALSALAALFPEAGAGALGGAGDSRVGLLDSPLVFDPARPASSPAPALLLRPYAARLPAAPRPSGGVFLPLLPLPRGLGPGLLLFEDPALAEAAGPGDLLPPLELRAACDALAALGALEAGAAEAETRWRRLDRRASKLFDRRGPYLFPRPEAGDWSSIFSAALDKGLLLSPDPTRPSLAPLDFDEGEIARLAALLP